MMKIKNKRSQESGLGMMGSHTIETILAILGIVILLFVLYAIISFIRSSSLEKDQADATRDLLKGELLMLKEGDSKIFTINSPQDWYLVSFDGGPVLSGCIPGQACICICKESNQESCGNIKTGSCFSINNKKIILNPVKIGLHTVLNIIQIKEDIKISEAK